MIPYQQLADLILSGVGVDAEGSGRYRPDNDIIPAINSAVSRSVYAGNYMLANRKESEMMMSELQETRIIQSNSLGGVALDGIITSALVPYDKQIWTVLGFIAEPATNIPGVVLGPTESTILRTDLAYRPGGENERPVKRVTIEQVARLRNDMEMPGNEVLAGGPMREYAYCMVGDRTDSDSVISGSREVILLPNSISSRKLFAMSYLRMPQQISTTTESIDMPLSSLRILADWALEYLSWKQGDGTTLNIVSSKDAAQLFNMTAN